MTTLEITLHSITLKAPLDQSGSTAVLAELVLPRPGIQSRSCLKTLDLKQGRRSLQRAPFHESALFKEKVEGRFGLRLQLTRAQPHPVLRNWLRAMLAVGFESAGDALALGSSTTPLRPLIRGPFDNLAGRLEDDEPDFIALGGVDLDPAADLSGELAIPLKLIQGLRHSEFPPGPKQRENRKRQSHSYKKGLTIGEAKLCLFINE